MPPGARQECKGAKQTRQRHVTAGNTGNLEDPGSTEKRSLPSHLREFCHMETWVQEPALQIYHKWGTLVILYKLLKYSFLAKQPELLTSVGHKWPMQRTIAGYRYF